MGRGKPGGGIGVGAIKVQKWAITEGRESGVTTWSLVSQVKISYGKRDPEGSRIQVRA